MAIDGISALIFVAQNKVENANNNALDGAKKQQGLVREQQKLHAQQSAFEDMVRDKDVSDTEYWQMNRMLASDGLSVQGVTTNNAAHGWDGLLGNTSNGTDGHWHAKLDATQKDGTEGNNAKIVDDIRQRFSNYDQDLQSQDKMGNFEVQSLMSDFNQAESLASSILKKRDDAGNSVIGKI